MTVGELARTIPRINVALENRQAKYQNSIVEVEGMINQTPITILIDEENLKLLGRVVKLMQ